MPAVLISLRARQFSAFRPNFERSSPAGSLRHQLRDARLHDALLQTLGTFYNRGAALMTVPIEVDGTAFELGPQRIGPDTTRAPAQPGSR